jgi:hypothetical protein
MPYNQIDITSVAAVASFLSIQAGSLQNQGELQQLVTGASQYWLNRTGLPTLNAIPAVLNENYDGNGNDRLATRAQKVISIASLTVGNFSVPASTSFTQPGWIIDQSGKFVVIRGYGSQMGNGGGRCGTFIGASYGNLGRAGGFIQGIQNINLQYTAGWIYTVVNETQTVTTQTIPLNQVPANSAPLAAWYSTQSLVRASNGVAFVQVPSAPAVGQFTVSATGVYGFNVADNAAAVLNSYTYSAVPADVFSKATKQVAVEYRRSGWLDQQAVRGELGSTIYRAWDVSPDIEAVIQSYKRQPAG